MGERVMPDRGEAWTVLDRSILYQNPWITVREDQVIQPDGRQSAWGVVEMKPGVSILPVDSDLTVYLVRVYRYTIGRDSIEAVAGGLEGDECPEQAAGRELREEAGIETATMIDLGVVDQLTEIVVAKTSLFLARDLSFGKPDREGSEQISLVKAPLEQALQWATDGTITHAGTATLIFRAARLLQADPS
jgi:8-oxo-dGTP pyrophosphatase MutT (NUDIX family)